MPTSILVHGELSKRDGSNTLKHEEKVLTLQKKLCKFDSPRRLMGHILCTV